jgi:hypothetical protein
MDNSSTIVNHYSDDECDLEPGESMYAIGLGMLWDGRIHGKYPEQLKDKWIVMDTISKKKFGDQDTIDDLIKFYKSHTRDLVSSLSHLDHPVFPNYNNILQNEKYFTIDIFDMKCLSTLEIIGVKKTYWIRMIQRRWKKLYKERLNIITKRNNPEALKYRQIHGKWSQDLSHLPSIRDIINF